MRYDVVVVGGGPSGTSAATMMAKHGLKVLLLEQGNRDHEKPCGGITPLLTDEIIEEIYGRKIPEFVKNKPSELGLYYWPPSGFSNGGRFKNYRLLNLSRSILDEWLRSRAASFGAEVLYNSTLVDFEKSGELILKIRRSDGNTRVRTSYLVGADGVFSNLRNRIFGGERKLIWIAQQCWSVEKEVENNFYVLFNERITSSYGYIIPKGDHIKLGLGVPDSNIANVNKSLRAFRELIENAGFKILSLIRSDIWAIPNYSVKRGEANILLVGDAGGFCNSFSGEGIRLGIESGEAAGQAILTSIENGVEAEPIYREYVTQLEHLIDQACELTSAFKNIDKENFVKTELSRRSLP